MILVLYVSSVESWVRIDYYIILDTYRSHANYMENRTSQMVKAFSFGSLVR